MIFALPVNVTMHPCQSTGNTTIYGASTVATTLRAIPVNFTEAGEILSISIYHDGGTGNVMLGVSGDQNRFSLFVAGGNCRDYG